MAGKFKGIYVKIKYWLMNNLNNISTASIAHWISSESSERYIECVEPFLICILYIFYGVTRHVIHVYAIFLGVKTNSINASTSTSRAQRYQSIPFEKPLRVFVFACDCRVCFGDQVHVVTKWNNKSLS